MRVELVDRLVYEVSSKFDLPITPAEARSLIPTPDEDRDLDWLFQVLSDVSVDHEAVVSLQDIDFERFTGVGIAYTKDQTCLFYFDELRQTVYFRDVETGETTDSGSFQFKPAETEPNVIRFYLRSEEAFAAVPGLESHWFFAPLWKYRGYLLQAGLASLLTNIFAIGTSLFAMVVYNRIIPSNAMSSLTVLVVGMGVLLIADYLVKTVRSKLLGVVGLESDQIIADRLFTQVLDIQYKAKKGSVGQLANVLKEYEQIREFFTSAALISLIDMPFAVIFVVVIWMLGGSMVYPVLAGIAVLFFVTLIMQPKMKRIAERSLEDAHNKHSVLVETLSGLETVKILGAGGLLRRRFKTVLGRQAAMTEESKRQTFFSSNLTQEVQQAVQIAVVAVGALEVAHGEFGFGAIIACTILSGKALMPFAQLAQLLSRLNQVVTGYRSLNELMEQPVEHDAGKTFISRGRYKGEIQFKDVHFSYPNQSQKALESVSFEIGVGEKVAIVGRVGSGKTTIGKLITKLFQPADGNIFLDRVEIGQLDPAEVRENIGLVTQDPWLIAGSIEQNVLLGAPNASTEDMLRACETAGVSDFANQSGDGLKQVIGERGDGLSGGQRQAISIARALVRNPPILLLDEPTSAMDARSEALLISRLKKSELNATLVVITHRTSLLALVDRVLVVDDGKIVASGSVEAFLSASNKKAQSAKGKDSDQVTNDLGVAT